jgi:NAD(P)-dependent dehydrogenase (short-subunit alcohol dehydrogenase family)
MAQADRSMSPGPIVLITGGATGIGLVIAEAFLNRDHYVHVCDADQARNAAFLQAHPTASASLADVADAIQVDAMFDSLTRQHGRLDILVNNAGIAGPTARVEAISSADWDRTVAVDLNGQFYCTRRAIPLLRAAGGGSIINIASNVAFFGMPMRAPYTACKWAMIGFTKTLAMELGPSGIRVNAICPGSVEGERIDAVIQRDADEYGKTPEQIRDLYQRQSSLRTFVSARNVADLALFLASEQGSRISGQAIGLDGHTESLTNWLD